MAKRNYKEQGTILFLLAIMLPAIIGCAALGIDVGYWYLIAAELSKSTEAAALAGAKNVGDTNILSTLVTEVGTENFSRSPLGSGLSPTFTPSQDTENQIFSVEGTVQAPRWFAYFRGPVTIKKTTKVKMRKKEIMLVLDDSGSMGDVIINCTVGSTI
jgi:uncharacterized membrane protein